MITTSFPFDPDRGRPERSAREHARALALERNAPAMEEQETERERRRAVVVDSREAITELRVGQRVSIPYKRRRYTGVVTKLGRSKVAVAYRIATGRDRDRVRLVHASLVRPVDGP